MTILFMSERGEGLGLAMRTISEGHRVLLYLEKEECEFLGDGIVEKTECRLPVRRTSHECIAANVDALLHEVRPDLVVFDARGFGKVSDYMRERGIPTFGSSLWGDVVMSESYGRQIARRLESKDVRGDAEGEFVVLWNGSDILASFLAVNESRLMDGNLGPVVGSGGCVMTARRFPFPVDMEGRLTRILRKVRMRGVLSLSFTLSSSLVVRSFNTTLRSLPPILELYTGSTTNLLFALATGSKLEGKVTSNYALSILLSVPPFPYPLPSGRVELAGVNERNLPHLWLVDVRRNGRGFETAETSGKIGWVTAWGEDKKGARVREARRRAYLTIPRLGIEHPQYRLDVGLARRDLIHRLIEH